MSKSETTLVEGTKNPTRYREMSVPHESDDALQDAMKAFHADVEAARVKYRIADVVVITMARWVDEEGEETEGVSQFSFGDSLRVLPMIAHCYGREKANHDALMARLTTKAR